MTSVSPAPEIVKIEKSAVVWSEGKQYTITSMLDLHSVLARSHKDGKSYQLPIKTLRATKDESRKPELVSLVDVPDKEWKLAQRRYDIIKPLLLIPKFYRTQKQVEARAKEFGAGLSTVYRWLDLYETTGLMSALLRHSRTDKGRSKIDPEVESIISDVIREEYLAEQRIRVVSVTEEVAARCKKGGIKPPHGNTVRARINALPDAIRIRKRHGRQIAKKYEPLRGEFPGADWPLAYVQIDHTKLDIILVDDQTRRPVGRPYITLALDVFSRMVTGFYLSFDPPSCFTVGLCISHSVLPKDRYLDDLETRSAWPIAGKMKTIHVDNALEFRSDVLQRACDQHQINIEWRPVREPQYGGHVERVFRTINSEIHKLPGTTFSSIEEREKYNSEKFSAFTLVEFEEWLTTFIVDKYHQRFHEGINMSPIKRFEQGVLGDSKAGVLGVGMAPRVMDEERFRIDFMPYVKRTIQNYGMRNHKVYYYHDVLRPWINAIDKNTKKRRLFVFHYDPRDISKYYFWDPELRQYFTTPYRDNRYPPISIWELREANRQARADGLASVDEAIIFDAYERMKTMTTAAIQKTQTERKKQRREDQRKRDHMRQMGRHQTSDNTRLKSFETDPFDLLDAEGAIEEFPIDDN